MANEGWAGKVKGDVGRRGYGCDRTYVVIPSVRYALSLLEKLYVHKDIWTVMYLLCTY